METYLNQNCPKCQRTNYFQNSSIMFMGGKMMEIPLDAIACWNCCHTWAISGEIEDAFTIDRGLECLDC